MKKRKERLAMESNPTMNNEAIKKILGSLIPAFVRLRDDLADGKLKFFEKIGLALTVVPNIPDVIDAAMDLPLEAWQGDYYDAAEIADISAHVKFLLPSDLEARSEELTLQIMEWVLTTVSTVDVIID